MTTANKITIGRILLIPLFVGFSLHYARSVRLQSTEECYRWAAVGVFLVAAVSDALDGYIARRFNQRSRLGSVLDPLADRALILAAMITVNLWPNGFPLWFVVFMVSRDAVLITGTLIINYFIGNLRVRPHWSGKMSTFLLMVTISWVMLRLQPAAVCDWLVLAATFFAGVSAVIYTVDGLSQFQASGHGDADSNQ